MYMDMDTLKKTSLSGSLTSIFILVFNLSVSTVCVGKDVGNFNRTVSTEWIDVERRMKVLNELEFSDPDGKVWTVPAGTIVDGASIPKLFWTIVGPPFVGKYRRASVVHDHYCATKTEPWREVHQMFYDGMIADNVTETKAKIMYFGVYHGGPRWRHPRRLGATIPTVPPALTEAQIKDISKWIETSNPDIVDIEERVDGGL